MPLRAPAPIKLTGPWSDNLSRATLDRATIFTHTCFQQRNPTYERENEMRQKSLANNGIRIPNKMVADLNKLIASKQSAALIKNEAVIELDELRKVLGPFYHAGI